MRWREDYFRGMAVILLAVALYQVCAIVGVVSLGGSPVRRHAIFLVIDLALALALLDRPRWLVFPVAVLLIQEFGTHGRRVLRWWAAHRGVDWMSIVVLLVLSVLVTMLWLEWRDRRPSDQQPG